MSERGSAGRPAADRGGRRRRADLDGIFGEVLPSTTADEREPGERGGEESDSERWLREQRPPHHF